ncbi:hypothetical protein G4Z16_17005 [Streptomyces bathyalis]|uniref:Uncharacterized protein n=1 Tax=Streptomyces bathyalis TaxID=2710756 RepID=A0A7T1T7G9_9ACTN|nr:hypothetical protein [Streptomyces bathyalis]QPP07817.1 hypothetical protein G4Z16_17005 [Streptomyces bathyalis]
MVGHQIASVREEFQVPTCSRAARPVQRDDAWPPASSVVRDARRWRPCLGWAPYLRNGKEPARREREAVMEEFRRHHYTCPQGRPDGTRRLDVFHDYGAFPVWGGFTAPPVRDRPRRELHGMLNPAHLGISTGLAADLLAWSEWIDAHSEWSGRRRATDADREVHQEHGRVLAGRLAEETRAEVLFCWRWADGDPDCPHCGQRVRTSR